MLSAACTVNTAKIETSEVIESSLLKTFSFMGRFVPIQLPRLLELDLHLLNFSGKGEWAPVKVDK